MNGFGRFFLTMTIGALLVAGPLAYGWLRHVRTRNFHVVEPGVLYRSAQLPVAGFKEVVANYGIKTIITLRDGESKDEKAEETWAAGQGVRLLRIPPRSWQAAIAGNPIPADIGVKDFLDVMANPKNHPVLLHCFGGIHRTGAHCAIYRMEKQGWTALEAMAEARTLGYSILDEHEDAQEYLKSYRHRREAVSAIPVSRTK